MRDAVERAGPPAGLVPALQRRAAGAVGSARRVGPPAAAPGRRSAGPDPRPRSRRGSRPASAGSRSAPARRPPPRPPPSSARADPALPSHPALGTGRPIVAADALDRCSAQRRSRLAGAVRATLVCGGAVFALAAALPHRALRAAADQPHDAAAAAGRDRRAADRGSGEPGGHRRRDRDRGGADVMADRPACGGVRAPRAGRSAAGVGAVGRLPGAGREPGVGTGVRHRVGPRRAMQARLRGPDHRVVDRLGRLDRDLRLGHLDQSAPPNRRASPTTP